MPLSALSVVELRRLRSRCQKFTINCIHEHLFGLKPRSMRRHSKFAVVPSVLWKTAVRDDTRVCHHVVNSPSRD